MGDIQEKKMEIMFQLQTDLHMAKADSLKLVLVEESEVQNFHTKLVHRAEISVVRDPVV